MKKQDLIELGIAEDVAEKVIIAHGKDIESHKSKLATLQTEADTLKTQLAEAGTTIESFKAMKPEELKAAADDWKAKAEKAQTDATQAILSTKRTYALEKELKETYKVKDVKSVKAHLDDEKIQYDEKTETFIGLKEQIEPIKSNNDYLFADVKEPPKIITGGTPLSQAETTTFAGAIQDRLKK